MSKLLKLVAGAALIAGAIALTPVTAQAQHWHHGWHHHGYRGGWAPGFGLGFGLGTGWGPYYGAPYYAAPDCGWESVRVRVRGHWRWRQVWRCW